MISPARISLGHTYGASDGIVNRDNFYTVYLDADVKIGTIAKLQLNSAEVGWATSIDPWNTFNSREEAVASILEAYEIQRNSDEG